MKIAIMQSGNMGFFPRYYKFLSESIKKREDEVRLFCPNSGRNKRNVLPNQTTFGSRVNWFIHSRLLKITGLQDIYSIIDTVHLIHLLKQYKPNVIHLNVVNDCMLNFPLFVHYVNKHKISVVWTMHDCRAFTGACSYFDEFECFRWKNGCGNCPSTKKYKTSYFDNSALQWKLRRKYIYKFDKLHIVTPSLWLLKYVKESLLNIYSAECIYNGIDISLFSKSYPFDFKKKHRLEHKKIILGLALNIGFRKGLDTFIQLSQDLPTEHQIVLVGGINAEDSHKIPSDIIVLPLTTSIEELATIYQSATVFVNPTLMDNFPTTNIEALASGTPVITYQTGGSAESIDSKSGISVPKGDYSALLQAIIYLSKNIDLYSKDNCLSRAQQFSLLQFDKYVDLYHNVIS